LHAQQKSIEDVESIFIVVGPGSATSLRASISIANTWHFVRKIALHGIEKTAEQSDEDALNTYTQKEQGSAEHQIYLEPKYSQGPQITASNKDQLGRPMASNS
jgi:tRNA A37 threonylcarbamoyladenosine modification protein TsaB